MLETSRLWREVVERVLRSEFPEVTLEHMLVDAAAMHLLRARRTSTCSLTENMFGDILTDEASMLAGSLGLLPSASLGDGHARLYEPIHGSAPDIAGRGIANPYGAILSAALLLRHSLELAAEAAPRGDGGRSGARARRAHGGHRHGQDVEPVGSTAAGDEVIRRLG